MDGTDAAPDLEGARILGQAGAMAKALFSIGAVCGECGKPNDVTTFEYAIAVPQVEGGKPRVVVQRAFMCARPECGGRERMREYPDLIASRTIVSWVIADRVAPLEEEGPEPETCRLCGVVKKDPYEPCPSCGKLDRPPKEIPA